MLKALRHYFGIYTKKEVEEYERALLVHEHTGYAIYSLEVAIKALKEERELMGA